MIFVVYSIWNILKRDIPFLITLNLSNKQCLQSIQHLSLLSMNSYLSLPLIILSSTRGGESWWLEFCILYHGEVYFLELLWRENYLFPLYFVLSLAFCLMSSWFKQKMITQTFLHRYYIEGDELPYFINISLWKMQAYHLLSCPVLWFVQRDGWAKIFPILYKTSHNISV